MCCVCVASVVVCVLFTYVRHENGKREKRKKGQGKRVKVRREKGKGTRRKGKSQKKKSKGSKGQRVKGHRVMKVYNSKRKVKTWFKKTVKAEKRFRRGKER